MEEKRLSKEEIKEKVRSALEALPLPHPKLYTLLETDRIEDIIKADNSPEGSLFVVEVTIKDNEGKPIDSELQVFTYHRTSEGKLKIVLIDPGEKEDGSEKKNEKTES